MVDSAPAHLRRMASHLQTLPADVSSRLLGLGLPLWHVHSRDISIGRSFETGVSFADPTILHLPGVTRLDDHLLWIDFPLTHDVPKSAGVRTIQSKDTKTNEFRFTFDHLHSG